MKEANTILKFINFIFLLAIGIFLFINYVFILVYTKNALLSTMLFVIFLLTCLTFSALAKRYEFNLKETEMPLIIGLFISAFGFLYAIFARSSINLIAVQIIIGAGTGVYLPAYLMLLKLHGGKSINWTKELIISTIILIAGMMVGFIFSLLLGLEMMFLILAALYIFASIFTLLLPRKIL